MVASLKYLTLIFSITLVDVALSYRTKYKYYEEAGGWVKFHEIPLNFTDAMIMCRLEGSVLASPITEGLKTVMATLQEQSAVGDVYTGFSTLYAPTYFASIEEYKKFSATGKCYKFHKFPETYANAYLTCQTERGNLIIINNDLDVKAVTFIKDASNITEEIAEEDVYIGYTAEDSWHPVSIHGQPLPASSGIKWTLPLDNSTYPYCVTITRKNLLNLSNCLDYYRIICEKDPDDKMFK